MRTLAPQNPKDRFDVYRFYNGLSEESTEKTERPSTRVPLVKAFLLEHATSRCNGGVKSPTTIFQQLGVNLKLIDDTFMKVIGDVLDPETKMVNRQTTGFIEQYSDRFYAYYTSEESTQAKRRVAQWVQSPDLDYTWFSSPLQQALWEKDVSKSGDDKFGKLVFRHESIFDMPRDFTMSEASEEDYSEDEEEEIEEEDITGDDKREFERRKARFEMGDRIGQIQKSLMKLQEDYDPLNALYALRLPSRTGRGGNDLYQNGQVTNHTNSFEAHRNVVRYLYRIYNSVLETTEESAWAETSKEQAFNTGIQGAPLIIRFSDPLPEATFDRWVKLAFQKRNRFKLWGDPIRLGPTKVHVYGADRHLWQPINLELTSTGMVAILPQGTCGNTFHRLVANIQHYLSPKITAWVGEKRYSDIVSEWPATQEESNDC